MTDNLGIAAASWEVRLLPFPKRFVRGEARGFCGGHAVGMVETANGKSHACWWPDGRPELLTLDRYKDLAVMFAQGDVIAGSWTKGWSFGAAAWRLRDGKLTGTDLHDKRFEKTWAEFAGHGLVLGVGGHKGPLGRRPSDCGLLWREDGSRHEIVASGDVCLKGTDGTRLVGSADGRATLWPSVDAAPVDLGPVGFNGSTVHDFDGDTQVGVAFKGMHARAALWRGTVASFTDLTPIGYEEGRVFRASDGWQVGLVRREAATPNGSSNLGDQAVLWHGDSKRWFDLNALLPAESGLNASVAWAIECRGDAIQICGEATRYEVSDPETDRASQFVGKAQAVVWTARRSQDG